MISDVEASMCGGAGTRKTDTIRAATKPTPGGGAGPFPLTFGHWHSLLWAGERTPSVGGDLTLAVPRACHKTTPFELPGSRLDAPDAPFQRVPSRSAKRRCGRVRGGRGG